MADDLPFYSPNRPPAPPRQPKPGELMFEFVRVSDRKTFRCELRFHGESYGWEAQWFDDGGRFASHGAFVTRAAAIAWAEHERDAFEQPPEPIVVPFGTTL